MELLKRRMGLFKIIKISLLAIVISSVLGYFFIVLIHAMSYTIDAKEQHDVSSEIDKIIKSEFIHIGEYSRYVNGIHDIAEVFVDNRDELTRRLLEQRLREQIQIKWPKSAYKAIVIYIVDIRNQEYYNLHSTISGTIRREFEGVEHRQFWHIEEKSIEVIEILVNERDESVRDLIKDRISKLWHRVWPNYKGIVAVTYVEHPLDVSVKP